MINMLSQEVEVWYIIPTLRSKIAQGLQKKGMTQKAIAKKLEISEAAVSQYIKGKRGKDISLPNSIQSEIDKSVENIQNNKDSLFEIQRICGILRSKKITCEIHRSVDGSIIEKCKICGALNK